MQELSSTPAGIFLRGMRNAGQSQESLAGAGLDSMSYVMMPVDLPASRA